MTLKTAGQGRSKQAKIRKSPITLREGHAAINVKVYHLDSGDASSEVAELAYDWTVEQFWQDAINIAHSRGYAGVFAEGRSDGWLVPYNWSKTGIQHTWGGPYSQGPEAGYPVYPDVEHNGADRERFRAFQREIQTLLADVQEMYTANLLEAVTE